MARVHNAWERAGPELPTAPTSLTGTGRATQERSGDERLNCISTQAGMVTYTWRVGEGRHLARVIARHWGALEQCYFTAGPELGVELEEVLVAPRTLP